MRRRGAVTAITPVLSLALCTCGGSSSSGEAGRTPDQVFSDVAAAVRSVSTYHLVIDSTQNGSPLRLDMHIAGKGNVSGSMSLQGFMVDVVINSGAAYLHGSKDFWTRFGNAATANLVGDRWVRVPTSAATSLTTPIGMFTDTQKIANCLIQGPHGTLTSSTSSVGGQAVTELRDPGDAPGSTPGTFDVAASGPPYPVRLVSNGVKTPGGPTPSPECESSSTTSSSSSSSAQSATITFSEWGAPVSVTPPPNALDFSQFGG